jgi:hypothetical protein
MTRGTPFANTGRDAASALADGIAGTLIQRMTDFFNWAGLKENVPFIVPFQRLGLSHALNEIAAGGPRFAAYGEQAYAEWIERSKTTTEDDTKDRPNLLARLHHAKLANPAMLDRDVATEAGAPHFAYCDVLLGQARRRRHHDCRQ